MNIGNVIPKRYEYISRLKFPDNALYSPQGRLWNISLGIYPCKIQQISTQYLSNKIEISLVTSPKGTSASLNGRYIGKTPLRITGTSPGFHNLQFTLLGYITSQMDIQITKNTKEIISIELEKLDPKRVKIESYINSLWNSNWDRELEASIDAYKIFWDRQFKRFIKLELGLKKLNVVANEIGIGVYPKYAHEDLIMEIVRYSVRKINENCFLMEKLKESIKTLSNTINCKICGRQFRPIDTHEVFFDVCNTKIEYCNPCISQCVWKDEETLNSNMTEKTRELMINDLYNLYKLIKIIPSAKFGSLNGYEFLKSIPDETRTDALLQIYKMRPYKDYVEAFGSWFKALIEAKVLSEGSLKTPRGIKCLALDGHECFSLIEKQVDDWLYIHGIRHEKEPFYPMHPIYNPKQSLRADYLVGNIYIEIWGLMGESDYNEKMKLKIKMSKECNINLLELEPRDLGNLNNKLKLLTQNTGWILGVR